METLINPPDRDRRFQVFISSTFSDLSEQRKKAINVVVNMGHIPIALENFSASDQTDLAIIENQIKNSQIYILIVGHRYGEVIQGREISYTELEYELALKYDLLILPFLLKKDEVAELRKTLNPEKIRDKKEIKNYNKYETFRNNLKNYFYKPWGKDDEFQYLVLDSLKSDELKKQIKKKKVRGLIWEPEESAERLITSASKNEFIVTIVRQLSGFKKLDQRCSEDVRRKKRLSKYFIETYNDYIYDNKVNLFLESGSTIAFVSREMIPYLSKEISIGKSCNLPIEIATNNVLTYLQFWLNAKMPCSLFPIGSPQEPYGASYGIIENLTAIPPDYSLPPLNKKAKEAIAELKNIKPYLGTSGKPALLLCAASGLQLSNEHKIIFPDKSNGNKISENDKINITKQISNCYGPHVGSYHNKVFKRFLYSTKIPTMIFITGEKIDLEIIVGRCHFILDHNELTWENFYTDHPLAFCVGCYLNKLNEQSEKFEKLGFSIIHSINYSDVTAFIARNTKFIDEFEKPIGIEL